MILVSTATGAWLYTDTLEDVGHIDGLRVARFSPRGRYISGVDRENRIRLYDPPTLRPVVTLGTANAQTEDLIWSPTGAATGERIATLPLDWQADYELIWSPDSRQLLEIREGVLYVWGP